MLFRVYVLDCLIEFMNEVVHIYNNSINIEERPNIFNESRAVLYWKAK